MAARTLWLGSPWPLGAVWSTHRHLPDFARHCRGPAPRGGRGHRRRWTADRSRSLPSWGAGRARKGPDRAAGQGSLAQRAGGASAGRKGQQVPLDLHVLCVSCLRFCPPGRVLPLTILVSLWACVCACASPHGCPRPAPWLQPSPCFSVSSELHRLFSSTSCPPTGCLPTPQPLSRTCCLLSPPSPLTLTLSPKPLPLLRTAPPVRPPP